MKRILKHFAVTVVLLTGLMASAQDNRSKIALDRAEKASAAAGGVLISIGEMGNRMELLKDAINRGDKEAIRVHSRMINVLKQKLAKQMRDCQKLIAEAKAATEGLHGAAKSAAQSALAAAISAASAVEYALNAHALLQKALQSPAGDSDTEDARGNFDSAMSSAVTAVGASNNAIINFMKALSATGEDAWIAAGMAAQAAEEAKEASPPAPTTLVVPIASGDSPNQIFGQPPTPERYLGQ
jgi:hypothetical protein